MARKTAKPRAGAAKKADRHAPSEDAAPAVYLPGMALAEGEALEADPAAYVMLHEMHADWPCLSFDALRDPGVPGDDQEAFPMSGLLVTGTQAADPTRNMLYVVRYANLCRTQQKSDSDSESDSESEDDEDAAEGQGRRDPRQHVVAVPHAGGVNRVRASPRFTATWSDAGVVHVWDVQDARDELLALAPTAPSTVLRRPGIRPIHTVAGHGAEGFALAWSPDGAGLLSGDCEGTIALTEAASSTFVTRALQRVVHADSGAAASVEDLQWSPLERTAFASVGTDGALRLWDTRLEAGRCALAVQVRPAGTDVNVLSWSALEPSVVATGADDGHLAAWDLRRVAGAAKPQPIFASPTWHKAAITSVEWSPHHASVLAAAGADDQLTQWDLSVSEEDAPRDAELSDLPAQLLFVHQGQRDIKELHWAPQHTGVLMSTALTGFNIFRTISV